MYIRAVEVRSKYESCLWENRIRGKQIRCGIKSKVERDAIALRIRHSEPRTVYPVSKPCFGDDLLWRKTCNGCSQAFATSDGIRKSAKITCAITRSNFEDV